MWTAPGLSCLRLPSPKNGCPKGSKIIGKQQPSKDSVVTAINKSSRSERHLISEESTGTIMIASHSALVLYLKFWFLYGTVVNWSLGL